MADAEVLIVLGAPFEPDPKRVAILVELRTECLGAHTGEQLGEEGSNVIGFSRWRNADERSALVEMVCQPRTNTVALAAAREVFEAQGLTCVVCSDQSGRILDRLVRPMYNDALRVLDEKLATAQDIDFTCRLGLGHPAGPLERVERSGLVEHYDICCTLTEVLGAAYAPPRRALVAAQHARASMGENG
ncbi:MAG: 3-hydroxyacyl-CoA dehydrogenase family protein [Hyphomonadaceae bacterium]|nr:3-hydroxyacyl-CoA dehydrogenase family protein [Hyphomonadaceae bacterium]